MVEERINIGDEAEDTVTGFKGIVVCKSEYLNGCFRLGIQPRELHEGSTIDAHYFDEPQLRKIKAKVLPQGPKNTGGPLPFMPRRAKEPTR